jgi:membrane-bound metal-dependent hydrolase YbcI (DUF457 family)
MATPIGHALAGCAIAACARPRLKPGILIFAGVAANAADLDFIPGWLIGDAGRYHHTGSHSLAAALLFGVLAALIARCWRPTRGAVSLGALGALAYASHPLLDALSMDTGFPYGCPLLWPFSEHYFIAPRALFQDVYRGDWIILLGAHNRGALGRELGILGGLLLGVLAGRRWSRRPSPAESPPVSAAAPSSPGPAPPAARDRDSPASD